MFTFVDSNISPVNRTALDASATIPSTASEGDLLVLGVMARSAVTTPTGWTLLETSGAESSSSQRQTLFYKIAESGDPGDTLTVTQASSARIEFRVSVYSYEGTVSVENTGSAVEDSGTSSLTMSPTGFPSVTVTTSASSSNAVGGWVVFKDDSDDLELGLVSASFNISSTGSTEITFSFPWVRRAGSPTSNRRLGEAELIPLEGDPRVNQAAVLVLVDELGNPKVNQAAVLVLYGTGSTPRVNQATALVLASFPRRRVITITD